MQSLLNLLEQSDSWHQVFQEAKGYLLVWVERKIERITRERLVQILGAGEGDNIYGLYTTARKHLIEEILPEIKAVMPHLTDHGPDHVAKVLDNAGNLIDIEHKREEFTHMELYSLILSILFHDVGNIYGQRENHQHLVADIYKYCRSQAGNNLREKDMVIKTTGAHCGTTDNDSNDTIIELPSEPVSVHGAPVNLQRIAAILRFADELQEGASRTSAFMQRQHHYPKRSSIHHKYASAINIAIDPGNERIALTYDIEVKSQRSGTISAKEENGIKELLKYIYKRISKLDQERKYAKHYCNDLSIYKYTSVTFNFWIDEQICNLELPQQYRISDLVVPGDQIKLLNQYNNDFNVDSIIRKIKRVTNR